MDGADCLEMKISIITPAYNSASTLEDTLKSVLKQTHADYELIVQDGGSKDGTLEILKRYKPMFGEKLKYASEPDHGLYDAINKGIMASTGDIVGILNSDDFYTSDTILEQVARELASDGNIDAVYGDIHFVRPGNLQKCVRYYSSSSFRPWRLRFGLMPAHPSFYCRRNVYEMAGLYSLEYKIASDYEMMVRLFQKEKIRAKYLPLDFVTMRTGGVSTRNIRNRLLLTVEDAKACRDNGYYSNVLLCSFKYFAKVLEFWI